MASRTPRRALHSVDGERPDVPPDPRVAAVLEVLAGRANHEVAREWSVDAPVLHRWVRDFVDAGTAQVTNRPDQDAAQQRDRFLAAFAHEVRTPLASAQGWVEVLLDDLPEDVSAPAVHRLRDALDRLADRTLDVQLLAAASMGLLSLASCTCRVGDLVGQLPGQPEVGGEGEDVELLVDPELFPRILRDVWQAAHQHPAPRAVRLVVSTMPRWVELRVERDADPIDPEILQALFEPFALNDDATGITIGLYLARALAVAHGGTIGMDQDDQGAALWVRVPRPLHGAVRKPEE
jgi:signal transduction histidine kinase